MIDRSPPDVVDHDTTRPTDHACARDTTDHDPTDPDGLTIDGAAAVLQITPNAVRQRIKRGSLRARKTDAGWRVWVPADHATMPAAGRSATDRPRPAARMRPTDQTDLAPLADLIARLSRENAELAANSATPLPGQRPAVQSPTPGSQKRQAARPR